MKGRPGDHINGLLWNPPTWSRHIHFSAISGQFSTAVPGIGASCPLSDCPKARTGACPWYSEVRDKGAAVGTAIPEFSPIALSKTTAKRGFDFHCSGCGFSHAIQTHPDFKPCWTFNSDVERPTVSPSIQVRFERADRPMTCHSFIENGKIRFLADCTHDMAGQTGRQRGRKTTGSGLHI